VFGYFYAARSTFGTDASLVEPVAVAVHGGFNSLRVDSHIVLVGKVAAGVAPGIALNGNKLDISVITVVAEYSVGDFV
jgi:hypothetical protein